MIDRKFWKQKKVIREITHLIIMLEIKKIMLPMPVKMKATLVLLLKMKFGLKD